MAYNSNIFDTLFNLPINWGELVNNANDIAKRYEKKYSTKNGIKKDDKWATDTQKKKTPNYDVKLNEISVIRKSIFDVTMFADIWAPLKHVVGCVSKLVTSRYYYTITKINERKNFITIYNNYNQVECVFHTFGKESIVYTNGIFVVAHDSGVGTYTLSTQRVDNYQDVKRSDFNYLGDGFFVYKKENTIFCSNAIKEMTCGCGYELSEDVDVNSLRLGCCRTDKSSTYTIKSNGTRLFELVVNDNALSYRKVDDTKKCCCEGCKKTEKAKPMDKWDSIDPSSYKDCNDNTTWHEDDGPCMFVFDTTNGDVCAYGKEKICNGDDIDTDKVGNLIGDILVKMGDRNENFVRKLTEEEPNCDTTTLPETPLTMASKLVLDQSVDEGKKKDVRDLILAKLYKEVFGTELPEDLTKEVF